MVDLRVRLGRLELPNPILVASGTFGYAREMASLVRLERLGGVLPKTVTTEPRRGNRPWRTVETASGLLNAIGLDNDGVEHFVREHLPYLRGVGCPVIVSIAGRDPDDYVQLAKAIEQAGGAAAIELNISCPNVSGGVDFGADPGRCRDLVARVRDAIQTPLLAKLTPNVTSVVDIAAAASEGGADAVVLINTVLAMAIDWRRRRPVLGNGMGGLSGPAIKPIALRCVYQTAQSVPIPIIGVGGVNSIDDVMEFLVAGASAVQVGTANYYRPGLTMELLDQLPGALAEINATSIADAVGVRSPDSSKGSA